MAKKKTQAPKKPSRARDKKKDEPIHDGKTVYGLEPPNHLFSFDVLEEDDPLQKMLANFNHYRWPLTAAMQRAETGGLEGVFVDARYGVTHWADWADRPPTWMDPHLLLELVKEDEEAQQVLQRAYKKNDMKLWKALEPHINRIFDDQYLPILFERFAAALPLMAKWLLKHHANTQLEDEEAEKSRKK